MEEYNPVDVLDSLSLNDFIDSVASCSHQTYLKVAMLIYQTIRDNIKKLKISQVCVATAMAYFHTFYSKISSNSEHHPYVIITACLFLACKVENVMRGIRSIIHIFFSSETDIAKREQQIYRYELILCEMTDFTLNFPHPYAKLGSFFKSFEEKYEPVRKRLQEVCGTILNQSYSCPFYLVFAENQGVFILSILKVAVRIVSAAEPGVDESVILATFSSAQRNLNEIELKAYRCLRKVFLLREEDSLSQQIAKAIEELYLYEKNLLSTEMSRSNVKIATDAS